MTKTIEFVPFFPDTVTAEKACARIEAEIALLKTPKDKGARIYQTVCRNAVVGYITKARAAKSQAKKWRSLAEAVFWWAIADSQSSNKPFKPECQPRGAYANKKAAKERKAEALKILEGNDPKTGKQWKNQEACKVYLMAQKGWSRTSCNTYLRGKKPGRTSDQRLT